jgi:27-O-demethylrifamycin SV methyltransferase
MSGEQSHAPDEHYNRITEAWGLLLGENLHYGVFRGVSDLPAATEQLTRLMVEGARLEPGLTVLDVGCGTGAPAVALALDCGVEVTGITTSAEGIEAARARAEAAGVAGQTRFEQRDGMDNGFADESFDRAWVLESSHLMRRRDRLIAECARVLRPGGRIALCDIILRRPLGLADVRRMRESLVLLRDVFGDARMEPLTEYERLMTECGLVVDELTDLTADTRPTFGAWRDTAERNRDEVVAMIGEADWRKFLDSCDVLEGFWDDGTLGYGLVAAGKP